MTFVHGKGTTVLTHGRDASAYLHSTGVAGSADTAETSTFQQTAKSFVVGLKDAVLSMEGFVDGVAAAADAVLQALFGVNSKIFSYYPEGDARGKSGYHMSAVQTSFEVKSDLGDAVGFSAEAQSNVSMERGESLKASADSITIDGSETSVDNAAPTTDGGAAYLHVISKSGGTTLAVIIEQSSDNGVGDAWATIATFAVASAQAIAERVAIPAGTTIERYTRATFDVGAGGTWKVNVAIARK